MDAAALRNIVTALSEKGVVIGIRPQHTTYMFPLALESLLCFSRMVPAACKIFSTICFSFRAAMSYWSFWGPASALHRYDKKIVDLVPSMHYYIEHFKPIQISGMYMLRTAQWPLSSSPSSLRKCSTKAPKPPLLPSSTVTKRSFSCTRLRTRSSSKGFAKRASATWTQEQQTQPKNW